MLRSALFPVLVFVSVLFGIMITSFGEERAGMYAFVFVCLFFNLVTRKPVFGICNQVRLKPACSVDETS